jgi:hypothetical protein
MIRVSTITITTTIVTAGVREITLIYHHNIPVRRRRVDILITITITIMHTLIVILSTTITTILKITLILNHQLSIIVNC